MIKTTAQHMKTYQKTLHHYENMCQVTFCTVCHLLYLLGE